MIIDNSVVKDVQIYLHKLKKINCLGCCKIEEIRDKDNETSLNGREGGNRN